VLGGLGGLMWVVLIAVAIRDVYVSMRRENRPAWAYVILTILLPPVAIAYASSHDMSARGRTGWAYALLTLLVYPLGVIAWVIDSRRFSIEQPT
jgi:hypothetical protein